MTNIHIKNWRLIEKIIILLCIVALTIVIGEKGSLQLQNVCFGFLLSLGALGILLALFERFGIIRFVYSTSERESKRFKMARRIAHSEKEIWGKVFSDIYYINYLEDELDKPVDKEKFV